jgi:hypothetical protein
MLYRKLVKRALYKYVKPFNPVKTSTSINATNMTFTEYIGLRK